MTPLTHSPVMIQAAYICPEKKCYTYTGVQNLEKFVCILLQRAFLLIYMQILSQVLTCLELEPSYDRIPFQRIFLNYLVTFDGMKTIRAQNFMPKMWNIFFKNL